MHTAYRLAPAPRGAALRSYDCQFCAHEDLLRPVFLDGPSGLVAAGAGCAAIALGRRGPGAAGGVLVEAAALTSAARGEEDLQAERRTRYAAALAEFEGANMTNHADSPALLSCRTTYHRSGGYPALGLTFPVFLAQVAETGILPEAPE